MNRSRTKDLWALTRSVLANRSFLISRDSVAAMHKLLHALLLEQQFDIIHADQLWMAQYGLAARSLSKSNPEPKTVLDQHNAVYLVPQRMAAATSNPVKRAFLAIESQKLARFEVEVCQRFDHVVWVTEEDRLAIDRVSNGQATRLADPVIPICVDPQDTGPLPRQAEANRVVFLGGMHWPPNAEGIVWFAKHVWPLVVEQVPNAHLTIIGKQPPASLSASELQNAEVTGYVEDLSAYLSEAAAFVVPLHAGGGMRVKILDAWCWGVPVVSTDIGAEGLRYEDRKNLLIANGVQEFADAVVSLLHCPKMAKEIGFNGRKTVEDHYDWRKVYRAWEEVYSFKS
jgi:glycosyltransferase involved in cell wall biosynthesis